MKKTETMSNEELIAESLARTVCEAEQHEDIDKLKTAIRTRGAATHEDAEVVDLACTAIEDPSFWGRGPAREKLTVPDDNDLGL